MDLLQQEKQFGVAADGREAIERAPDLPGGLGIDIVMKGDGDAVRDSDIDDHRKPNSNFSVASASAPSWLP